jgi:hypothetical protein
MSAKISAGGKAALGEALLSSDPVRIYAALAVAPSLGVTVSRKLLLKLLRTHSEKKVRRAAGLRYLLQFGAEGFTELGHSLMREEVGWEEVARLLGDLARSKREVSVAARQSLIECAGQASRRSKAGLACMDELTLVPGGEVATALNNLSANWSSVVQERAKAALEVRKKKGLDVKGIINKPSDVRLGQAREASGSSEIEVRVRSKKGGVDPSAPLTPSELMAMGLPADYADFIRSGFSRSAVLIKLRKVGPGFARIKAGDPWANHPILYDGLSYHPPLDEEFSFDPDSDFNRPGRPGKGP